MKFRDYFWWLLMAFTLALPAVATVAGCGGPNLSPPPVTGLPSGAYNLNSVGNGWYTFELEINGRYRKFLYHRYDRGETICELGK